MAIGAMTYSGSSRIQALVFEHTMNASSWLGKRLKRRSRTGSVLWVVLEDA